MKGYGYKGIETALNGLTKWISDNLEIKGNTNQRYNEYCKIIIEYGKLHIPGFKKKGHLTTNAEYVAKKISWNNKFEDFSKWALTTYKTQQP
jgi:hypothetical protein